MVVLLDTMLNDSVAKEMSHPASQIEALMASSETLYKEITSSLLKRHRSLEVKAINELEAKDAEFISQLIAASESDELLLGLKFDYRAAPSLVQKALISPTMLHQKYDRRAVWDYLREMRSIVETTVEKLQKQASSQITEALTNQHQHYTKRLIWMKSQYEGVVEAARSRAEAEISAAKTLHAVILQEREGELTSIHKELLAGTIKKIQNELATIKEERDELVVTQRALSNSTGGLLSELEDGKHKISQLSREKEELRKEILQWMRENATRVAELEELSGKYRKVVYEQQEFKRDMASAKSNLLILEETNSRLKTSLNAVSSEAARLEKLAGDEKDKTTETRKDLQELRVQHALVQSSLSALEKKAGTTEKFMEEYKAQASELRDKYIEERKKAKAAEDEANLLSGQIDKLEAEKADSALRYRELDTKYVDLQMTLVAALKSLEQSEKMLIEAENEEGRSSSKSDEFDSETEQRDATGTVQEINNDKQQEPATEAVKEKKEGRKKAKTRKERVLMSLKRELAKVLTKSGHMKDKETDSQVAKLRRQLEREVRHRLEKDLEFVIRLEFLEKNANDLKIKVKREMNKQFALRLNNAIQNERIKSKKTDSEWRELAEQCESRLKVMEKECKCGAFEEGGMTREQLQASLDDKEEELEALTLVVKEKEILLAEMTLIVRNQKTEITEAEERILDLEDHAKGQKAVGDIQALLRRRSLAFLPQQAHFDRRSTKLGRNIERPSTAKGRLGSVSGPANENNIEFQRGRRDSVTSNDTRRSSTTYKATGSSSTLLAGWQPINEEREEPAGRPYTAPSRNSNQEGGNDYKPPAKSSSVTRRVRSAAASVSIRSTLKESYFNQDQQKHPNLQNLSSFPSSQRSLNTTTSDDPVTNKVQEIRNLAAQADAATISFGNSGLIEIKRRLNMK